MQYTALRLFNVYGPGQSLGYLIPDKVAEAKRGGFEILGGNITKDFVYVEDVARAFVKALESNAMGAFNIGSGQETPLAEVANRIAKKFGVPHGNIDSLMPTRMRADIRWAQKQLGWEPTVSLGDGLDAICASETQPVSA
jgi:nucleoside-diphosphate-sugar epimerase